MSEQSIFKHAYDLLCRVATDILATADDMHGTVIGAAAFGGFCLLAHHVYSFYCSFDKDILSKEHVLAIFLMLLGILFLPLLGVIFAGIYGISNVMAAWQIGLTTPLLIESAYLSYAKKAKSGEYHKAFIPEEPDA